MPERPRLPLRLRTRTPIVGIGIGLGALILGLGSSPCRAGSNMTWSPDGHWLAYVTVERSGSIPAGWLFRARDVEPDSGTGPASQLKPKIGRANGRRLWVTRSDGGLSALLESSNGPITAPSWREDGGAILFGRVAMSSDGKPIRYEIVVQDAPARQRVLWKTDLAADAPIPANLASMRPAWSPNRRFAVVPWPPTWGLAVLRISGESAEWAGELPGGAQPSWAPDNRRLAYLRREGDRFALCWTDAALQGERRLLDLGPSAVAPRWGWEGLDPNRTAIALRSDPSASQPRSSLIQVSVETNQGSRTLRTWEAPKPADLPQRPSAGAGTIASAIALSSDGEVLFHTEGHKTLPRGSQLVQVMLKRDEVYAKTSAVDPSLWIAGLELSPRAVLAASVTRGGSTIAGELDDLDVSPPVLITMPLTVKEERLLDPDDSSRREWLSLIAWTIREVMDQELKRPRLDGLEIERPYQLPCLGELQWNEPRAIRLRGMAQSGIGLIDELEAADQERGAAPDPERIAALDELRLGFLSLLGDNEKAMETLDRVEDRMETREDRIRAAWLRSQLWANMGRLDEAKACLDAPGVEARAIRSAEQTPLGPRLEETPPPPHWTQLLRREIAGLEKSKAAGWRKPSDSSRNPQEPEAEMNAVEFGGPGVFADGPDKIQIQLPPIR